MYIVHLWNTLGLLKSTTLTRHELYDLLQALELPRSS